jgi:hypothetical protein
MLDHPLRHVELITSLVDLSESEGFARQIDLQHRARESLQECVVQIRGQSVPLPERGLELNGGRSEPDGSSLFDHTTVVYGSNIRTGHSLDNCPTLVAGRGAGLRLGENIVASKGTPLCNVWLTILRGSGVDVTGFGDSTGVLEPLASA